MSIGSTLKDALGIIAGILIPGASEHTTDLKHSIQQEIAKVYGAVAAMIAANPLVAVAAELVAPVVQVEVDKVLPKAA